MFLLISIDIQVLSDLVPRFGWHAVAARRGAIILFILRILAILLQTTKRAADKPPRDRRMHREKAPRSFMSIDAQQEYGEKVWKPLMSIERRSNKAKRSVRTLMCPRDLLVLPTTARDRPSPYDKGKDTVARGPVPRVFLLSEAGFAGCPGFSGWGLSGTRRKGLEDLNVYSISKNKEKRSVGP